MVSNGASTCMKKVPKVHVGGLMKLSQVCFCGLAVTELWGQGCPHNCVKV